MRNDNPYPSVKRMDSILAKVLKDLERKSGKPILHDVLKKVQKKEG